MDEKYEGKRKTMKNMNFGNRMLLGLILVTLVLSTINLSNDKRRQKEDTQAYMQVLCQQKAKQLDQGFVEAETVVHTLGRYMMSTLDTAYNLDDEQQREEYVDAWSAMIENAWEQLGYINRVYMHFNPGLSSGDAGYEWKKVNGKINRMAGINLNQYDSLDIEHVGWYYLPLEARSGIWMEPFTIEEDSVITYVLPLHKDDATVGVLGIDIPLTHIFDEMGALGLQTYGQVYLIGKSGNVIAQNSQKTDADAQSYSYNLRNNMNFVLSTTKGKTASSWYEIVLLIVYAITICILIGSIILGRLNRNRNYSDQGRRVDTLRFALRVAIAVLLVVQLSFLGYSLGGVQRAAKVKVKAKNSYSETIRVVGDAYANPYCYKDGDGNINGHDIEVMNIIANKLKVNVEYELMTQKEAIKEVNSGSADILLGIDALADSSGRIVSTTYLTKDSYVIYGKTPVEKVTDFYGKNIAVVEGHESLDIYGIEKDAKRYESCMQAMDSVVKGENEYVIMSGAVGRILLRDKKYSGIKQVFDMMESKIALGVSSSNMELLNQLDEILAEMRTSGEMDRLQEKWMKVASGEQSLKELFTKHLIFWVVMFVLTVVCIAGLIISHVQRLDEQTKAELKQRSEIDHLTKIYNRQAGEEKIKTFLDSHTAGMFCMLDVDKFKSINDTYGHSVGDIVLAEIAECLQRAYHDPAVVMRFGGDEFAFYIPGVTDEQTGREEVERLFEYIDVIVIRELKERKIAVSAGAYLYDGQESVSFMDMYKYADTGLYDSKDVLGNYVSF